MRQLITYTKSAHLPAFSLLCHVLQEILTPLILLTTIMIFFFQIPDVKSLNFSAFEQIHGHLIRKAEINANANL